MAQHGAGDMGEDRDRLRVFMEITGATEEHAEQFLANHPIETDIQTLVNIFLDGPVADANYIPPIPPTIDQLMPADAPPESLNTSNQFLIDRMRNFRMEGELQENLMSLASGRAPTGESSSDGRSASAPTAAAAATAATATTRPTQGTFFEDLFRPPLDLLFRGELRQARDEGMATNRWLLVNLMNREVFTSLIINRDIWPNHAVRELIQEHFILIQLDHSCSAGEHYSTMYNVGEDEFPHINLIDPRTGESLHSWGGDSQAIDVLAFTAYLRAFLELNPTVEGYAPPHEVSDRLVRQHLDMEAEIQSAIQASLVHSNPQPPN